MGTVGIPTVCSIMGWCKVPVVGRILGRTVVVPNRRCLFHKSGMAHVGIAGSTKVLCSNLPGRISLAVPIVCRLCSSYPSLRWCLLQRGRKHPVPGCRCLGRRGGSIHQMGILVDNTAVVAVVVVGIGVGGICSRLGIL